MAGVTAINDILVGLAAVEATLRISTPDVLEIKRVYAVPPSRDAALETPCFINTFDLQRVERHAAGGTVRIYYTINAQLFVDNADVERGALIAAAFLSPLISALNQNITLNGTVGQSDIRGGTPTLGMLERGKAYPGLNLYIDVWTQEGIQFS